jgi:lysophospholipase L1-like esterase
MQPTNKLYILIPTATNTDAVTINVNAAGAVPIKSALNASLAANSLLVGCAALMIWNGSAYQFLVSSPVDASGILADVIDAKNDAESAKTAAEAARDTTEALFGDASLVTSTQAIVPYVFDMHWKALRGVGWSDDEAGGAGTYVGYAGTTDGVLPYTITTDADAGDTELTFTGTTPVDSQLIVVKGVDGEYYSVSVNSTISGTTKNLNSPLPVDVAAGQNAWAFYINEFHPNQYGYRAIADTLARDELLAEREVYQGWLPDASGTATVSSSTSDNSLNPGSTTAPAYLIAPAAAGDGCIWSFRLPSGGQYRAVVKVNGTNDADMRMRINFGVTSVYDGVLAPTNDGVPKSLTFEATDVAAKCAVKLMRATSTASFITSYVSIRELIGPSLKGFLSRGKHVLIGDSWFAVSSDDGVGDFGIIDRFRERYTDATWVNAGVGGNTAGNIVSRIDDVLDANPDAQFVHVMVSTNDINGQWLAKTFSQNIGIIRSKILARKMVPIIYTGYVGSPSRNTDNFRLSRQYARDVAYYEYKRQIRRYSVSTLVKAGTTEPVLTLGKRYKPFVTDERYLSKQCKMQEGTSMPAASNPSGDITFVSGASTSSGTITPTPGRYVQMVCENSTGSDFIVSGYVDLQDE